MRKQLPYDARSFFGALVAMLLLVVAMKATGGAAFVLMIPLTFFALIGNKPENLVFILLLSISTILGNGYLMPKDLVYAVSERGLFLGLAVILVMQIAGRHQPRQLTPILGLIPYVVYMALVSITGWSPMISYLKLLLFTSILFAYYAIAVRSSAKELDIRKLRGMVLAVACFFILGSVVAQRFGWAYMSLEELASAPVDGNNLYMGMTSHANSLGCVLTAFSLILLTDMLFTIQRPEPLYLVNILCAVYLIARSGSRTSMGSFVLSCCFAFYCFRKTRSVFHGWKSRVTSFALLLMAVCGVGIMVIPAGREKVVRFVVKNRNENDKVILTTQDVMSSRQGKIDEGIANWKKSPMFGNGFQVSENMKGFRAQSYKDVLSAPVEKSVWFSAVLEEGGLIGFGIFVIFLLMAFHHLVHRKAYIGGTLFFALFSSNFGEFTFFSMSGAGRLQWGMVFVGLILDGQRLKNESRSLQFVC